MPCSRFDTTHSFHPIDRFVNHLRAGFAKTGASRAIAGGMPAVAQVSLSAVPPTSSQQANGSQRAQIANLRLARARPMARPCGVGRRFAPATTRSRRREAADLGKSRGSIRRLTPAATGNRRGNPVAAAVRRRPGQTRRISPPTYVGGYRLEAVSVRLRGFKKGSLTETLVRIQPIAWSDG